MVVSRLHFVPTAFSVNVAGKPPQKDPVWIYHQIRKSSKKSIMLKIAIYMLVIIFIKKGQ